MFIIVKKDAINLESQRKCRSLLALYSHDIETSMAAALTSPSVPNRIRETRDRVTIFSTPGQGLSESSRCKWSCFCFFCSTVFCRVERLSWSSVGPIWVTFSDPKRSGVSRHVPVSSHMEQAQALIRLFLGLHKTTCLSSWWLWTREA